MPDSRLLERVAKARDRRRDAEQAFLTSLVQAHQNGHSWTRIAAAAHLTMNGVKYRVLNLNERRNGGKPDA